MLFNSAQFIFVFLPIVLSVFFLLGRLREPMLALMWLAAASLFFYGWDDPYRLLPLILFSIAFNFFIGRMLLASQSRIVLIIGICGDLLLLGYFKYAEFSAGNLQRSEPTSPCKNRTSLCRSASRFSHSRKSPIWSTPSRRGARIRTIRIHAFSSCFSRI